jgi:hypothetical protein
VLSQQHGRLTLISYESLAKWKRDAEAWYQHDSAMFEGLFHPVEANVVRMCLNFLPYGFPIESLRQAKGDDHQSVAATLIREVERNKLSSRERSWLAATL